MRKMWVIAACLALFLAGLIIPGIATAGSGYGTGDPGLDEELGKIDRAAREGVEAVAQKIGRKFDVPPEMVDWMLKKVGMSPGDAYMAAKVAKVADRSVEDVVAVYKQNKGKGWGVIAKKMGIKPGSAEFHDLKSGAADISGQETGPGKGRGKSKKVKSKGKKW